MQRGIVGVVVVVVVVGDAVATVILGMIIPRFTKLLQLSEQNPRVRFVPLAHSDSLLHKNTTNTDRLVCYPLHPVSVTVVAEHTRFNYYIFLPLSPPPTQLPFTRTVGNRTTTSTTLPIVAFAKLTKRLTGYTRVQGWR